MDRHYTKQEYIRKKKKKKKKKMMYTILDELFNVGRQPLVKPKGHCYSAYLLIFIRGAYSYCFKIAYIFLLPYLIW